MKVALLTLSKPGCRIIEKLLPAFPEASVFVHEKVPEPPRVAEVFEQILPKTRAIFPHFEGLVFVAPCGVVVRALSGVVGHKKTDPAVVVVDAGGRHAISLLSGHEGGANSLAVKVANVIHAEPVISTTTEATKDHIIGIGCRKHTSSKAIVEAVLDAINKAGLDLEQIRFMASVDLKKKEPGLLQASKELGLPFRVIASEEIRTFAGAFDASEFVMNNVNLPAVAEPCALLAGRRTKLLLKKTIYPGITIAIAKENFMWSE